MKDGGKLSEADVRAFCQTDYWARQFQSRTPATLEALLAENPDASDKGILPPSLLLMSPMTLEDLRAMDSRNGVLAAKKLGLPNEPGALAGFARGLDVTIDYYIENYFPASDRLGVLGHELGHVADQTGIGQLKNCEWMTPAQSRQVTVLLEGRAQLHAYEIRRDVLEHGGPDIAEGVESDWLARIQMNAANLRYQGALDHDVPREKAEAAVSTEFGEIYFAARPEFAPEHEFRTHLCPQAFGPQ